MLKLSNRMHGLLEDNHCTSGKNVKQETIDLLSACDEPKLTSSLSCEYYEIGAEF